MENILIQTSTKEVLKKMLNDEWITIDAIIDHKVKIELILMYQYGIVPLNQIGINYDTCKFLHITISGQIEMHKTAIKNCKIGGVYKDVFYEGLGIMHEAQLKILVNLKNLMITQYN